MFVFVGARTRVAAMALALATAVPLFPRASATERPRIAAAADGLEAKAPKKTKRKKSASGVLHQHTPRARMHWGGPRSMTHWTLAPMKRVNVISVVLATARAQLGKPYHYGSIGPSSFDCSGFTRFVWNAAGVALPHNSSAQYAATKHIPLSQMRPGDLVFSHGHVGLYIGGGKMIHAPQTGDHVRIAPVHSNAYSGGRPLI